MSIGKALIFGTFCLIVEAKGGHHHKEVHAETPFSGEQPDLGKNSEGVVSLKNTKDIEKIMQEQSVRNAKLGKGTDQEELQKFTASYEHDK